CLSIRLSKLKHRRRNHSFGARGACEFLMTAFENESIPGVVLALDVGEKRVGTALYDPKGKIARPHETFLRAKGAAERAILALITELGVETVVVGNPL